MIGNVWEWVGTPSCARGPALHRSGGSHLFVDSDGKRSRAAARQSLEQDFSTAHIGFRIVRDLP